MAPGVDLLVQFFPSFAKIVLAATGLAIIFGIMGVINLAHGEFIMVGAYATTLAYNGALGALPLVPVDPIGVLPGAVQLPAAMLTGVLVTALFGLVVERTVISGAVPNWIAERTIGRPVVKPMYDRLLDSMVATWGISLIMVQLVRNLYGNSLNGIGIPFGQFSYGNGLSISTYKLVLAGVAALVLLLLYVVFVRTDYGMRARATIQNEGMAKSLGVDTERTYMATFALGSGLAGLTGALYAPLQTIVPGMGGGFLVEAFVAVVVGGASVVVGTLLAGGLLGFVYALFANVWGTFAGRIMLLVVAILVIRFVPQGLSSLVERIRDRWAEVS
ncbi:ABC transporter permease subunit [Halorientalis regularis]|jgi:urea ABC transporter permease protein UrtB|uniref:Amino acid/amide ABC transporter membrane protein 1, HAAT family n=1 Tax=Halorientalis regularis TaxID=660518 RepID=A0A1G7M1L5_9EURY|nr:branched-chain amino acid ABC transporter permease [Halorientalis regularis]SDF55069.1 amino acid/amide ABC transporter membrane protein 1, HAAT family [Halorientalis regularis]